MRYSNVLVTGGAGFLGSQLIKRLLPISEKIYIIDDLSTGNRFNIPVSEKIILYQDSYLNEELLNTVLPNVEYVFHLACQNIIQSMENPTKDFEINLNGGFTLLKKTQKVCPNIKRFIYTSTASVYGDSKIIPTPESYLNPSLPYAASKLSMEHYCQIFHKLYSMPITILRLSNVYGPGQIPSNPYSGVVSKFLDALKNTTPMIIYGDGTQTRDFTFVADVMDVLLMAGINDDFVGDVFNIGTGVETNILELSKIIYNIAGYSKYALQHESKRMVDNVNQRCLDISKINNQIGWTPKYDIHVGLRKTFEWWEKESSNAF